MIQKALTIADDAASNTMVPKPTPIKKAVAKKGKKGATKKKVDGIARFFNDYGESPHL